jgi:hypothetical protein
VKLCIPCENDPSIIVQEGHEPSCISHWFEDHAAMCCKHAGNSKVEESIKPTLYPELNQNAPNSKCIGKVKDIFQAMTDVNGFEMELNRVLNEIAAEEGWGQWNLGKINSLIFHGLT